jgi:hypothetical protein
MAHNWTTHTITNFPPATTIYVAVTGDDMVGDGTPDNPYRSITKAGIVGAGSGKSVMIGTGGYTGSLNYSQLRLFGELGKETQTIINLNGGTLNSVTITGIYFKNLTIKNGTINTHSNVICSNTNFIDVSIMDTVGNANLDLIECDLINTTISNGTSLYKAYLSKCKLFNSTLYNQKGIAIAYGCYKLESCYIDSFSRVQFSTFGTITEIDFNDIEGQIMFQDGANPDVYLTLAQALVDYPVQVGPKNINSNPLFADVSKMSFVVGNASPLIGNSKTNGNIGNAKRGDAYFCGINNELKSIASGGSASLAGIVGTTDLTVPLDGFSGTITSGPILISSSGVAELGAINYKGNYALDSSLGGTACAQVPDSFEYTGGNPPNNISYKLRYSTSGNMPLVDGQWDNGGLIPAGVEYCTSNRW